MKANKQIRLCDPLPTPSRDLEAILLSISPAFSADQWLTGRTADCSHGYRRQFITHLRLPMGSAGEDVGNGMPRSCKARIQVQSISIPVGSSHCVFRSFPVGAKQTWLRELLCRAETNPIPRVPSRSITTDCDFPKHVLKLHSVDLLRRRSRFEQESSSCIDRQNELRFEHGLCHRNYILLFFR
jgi:hypothetical protein